jgi:hypothetical protein
LPLDEEIAKAMDSSRGHKKIICTDAFFVFSDVTAENRLVRVLSPLTKQWASPSANG